MERHFSFARVGQIAAAVVIGSSLMTAAPAFAQITRTEVAQVTRAQASVTGPTLTITMDQAVAMALESNLGIKFDRLNPTGAAQDVANARAAYEPALFSNLSRGTSSQPSTNFTQGGSVFTSSSVTNTAGVQQLVPWFGGNYNVSWTGQRSASGGFPTFNPSLGSQLSVAFTQPLLRNFRTDATRTQLKTVIATEQIDDLTLREQAVQLELNVRGAYLQLVGAIKNREVAESVLEVSQQQDKNDRARVAAGATAAADIVGDEAEIANNEVGVIAADANIATSEDNLRGLILDTARPDFWTVKLNPADEVQVVPRQIDVDKAVQTALTGRADLLALRRQLDLNDLNINLLHNQKLPQLTATVNYSAIGIGGTEFVYGSGFPPPIESQTNRSFDSAVSDSFTNAFPSWTYGLAFSYPVGNGAAQASLAKARIQKTQAEINLKGFELQIATAVRAAARNVDTALKQVQATQIARSSEEQRLDATEKKFAVGLSSPLEIIQVQRDLAAAKFAELNAKISYNQALITFDAVQK